MCMTAITAISLLYGTLQCMKCPLTKGQINWSEFSEQPPDKLQRWGQTTKKDKNIFATLGEIRRQDILYFIELATVINEEREVTV